MGRTGREGAVRALGRQMGAGIPPLGKTFCWTQDPPQPNPAPAARATLKDSGRQTCLVNPCLLPSRIKSQRDVPVLPSHLSRRQEPLRELKVTQEKIMRCVHRTIHSTFFYSGQTRRRRPVLPEACFSLFSLSVTSTHLTTATSFSPKCT